MLYENDLVSVLLVVIESPLLPVVVVLPPALLLMLQLDLRHHVCTFGSVHTVGYNINAAETSNKCFD